MTKNEIIRRYGIDEYHRRLEQNKERGKKWQKEHREQHIETTKKWQSNTQVGRANYLLMGYRKADRKANRGECTLTSKWIIDNVFNKPTCHYCGKEFSWKEIGCDRMNPSLPHTPSNCVPCCPSCNSKKQDTPYNEYLQKIRDAI